jgi:hypothetical protein
VIPGYNEHSYITKRGNEMINIKPINQAYMDQGLKILIFGPAGVGKTVACTTAPSSEKSILISSEAGLLSIKDSTIDSVAINSIQELKEVYSFLNSDKSDHQWIFIDSLSDIAEVLLSEEKKKVNDPRQAYGVIIEEMGSIIRAFRDLPKRNVVMTCKQERVQDNLNRLVFSPGLPGAKLGQQIPYFFDGVFALRIIDDGDGGTYRAFQTQPDLQYACKDRSGKLDSLEKPSFESIAAKIYN